MDILGFRARCDHCNSERDIFGPFPARTPAQLDAIEMQINGRSLLARCPTCDRTELVAMFIDGTQTEPWQDADEMERQHGASAGPLPRKPWPDTN